MSLRPRPEIEDLAPSEHGGINYAELAAMGIQPGNILDFSVSSNPYPPPLALDQVVRAVNVPRYPDSAATLLRQRLSALLEVPADWILAGNGSTELIRLVALAYFGHGDCVLMLGPTFGEYEVACRISGAKIMEVRARAENGFRPDIGAVTALIRETRPKGVFICNPNNPTGRCLSRPDIEAVLDALGDGLLVLDEAYIAFVEDAWSSLDLVARSNVVILRSMTKDYGLAGLRLGYAISRPDIISCLRRVCPPWNVNVVAQQAGVSALEGEIDLPAARAKIKQAREFLCARLERLGFQTAPSDANFFLARVGQARAFRAALLRQGILVRDCASFGLPEYARIAARPQEECDNLIEAVKKCLNSGFSPQAV
ncbi:MAG: histidinol-phosphate aminotransferase family protein [Chloroflexi bacterium]|nr:histidinol-phosphate aminotransferase family protein [Chloroflexota bacterium]